MAGFLGPFPLPWVRAPRRKHQQPKKSVYLRDRSCRLRCSLRLNARLQYWHLYFFSGTEAVFLGVLLAAEVLAGSELVALSD
jgi:hypothetical protein